MINTPIIELLQCPITKDSLVSLNPEQIKEINEKINSGSATNIKGAVIDRKVDSGYMNENCQLVYPIEQGIIILLPEMAIVIDDSIKSETLAKELSIDKKQAQQFYDELGWKKNKDDHFVDAEKFEDLRPIVKQYIHKCHLRVSKYLKHEGDYLLDVASGPVQYPEYLTYSENYKFRICMDFSFLALKEAKNKLGEKGIYILGDITNIPLKENMLDAVISLHTIYHVPEDEQVDAINEVYRVLKPESTAVIVYSWGKHAKLMNASLKCYNFFNPLWNLLEGLKSIIKRVIGYNQPSEEVVIEKSNDVKQSESGKDELHLYFHPHDYAFFKSHEWNFNLDILVWRTVSVPFTFAYIKKLLFGKQILALLFFLENKFPHFFGRIGQYPLFAIKK